MEDSGSSDRVPDGALGRGSLVDDTSVELLARARAGDERAAARLTERYVVPFRRWASGRLPHWARSALDTDDIVQDTVMHTLARLTEFEPRGEGALLAYLRAALQNRIRKELRGHARSRRAGTLDSNLPDDRPSPFATVVTQQTLERYELALERLPAPNRQAIVARVELGMSWDEVARATGKPSADAARMAVSRALRNLAEEMSRGA